MRRGSAFVAIIAAAFGLVLVALLIVAEYSYSSTPVPPPVPTPFVLLPEPVAPLAAGSAYTEAARSLGPFSEASDVDLWRLALSACNYADAVHGGDLAASLSDLTNQLPTDVDPDEYGDWWQIATAAAGCNRKAQP